MYRYIIHLSDILSEQYSHDLMCTCTSDIKKKPQINAIYCTFITCVLISKSLALSSTCYKYMMIGTETKLIVPA